MKKLLMYAAACALVLSSCAKNELIDGSSSKNNDGKIKFSAVKSLNSLKADPMGATADLVTIGKFKVTGYLADNTSGLTVGTRYLDETEVSYDPATLTWEYTNPPFWPSGSINFFAYSAKPYKAVIDGLGAITYGSQVDAASSTMTLPFEVQTQETNQVDLVVAGKTATKETRTSIMFKHALTQVVFYAGVVGGKIEVAVDEVEIANLYGAGNATVTAANTITWVGTGDQDKKYTASPTSMFPVATVTDHTTYSQYTQIRSAAQTNNALLMIPQDFTAWNPQGGANATAQSDAYIRIKAVIRSATKFGTAPNDKYIYYLGTEGADQNITNAVSGDLYIPVASIATQLGQWVPGRKVKYIITFGDSGSGSNGGGYTEDGTPVLTPIRFAVELADWTEVEVPLLTVTFSGNSSAINAAFIDGYTAQLLADINAAREEKAYDAKITITGTMGNDAALDLSGFANNTKFSKGSKVTYDFNGVTFDSKEITFTTPSGWTAVPATDPITAAGTLVLTRE